MIQRLDHVNIVVSDLTKAGDFFSLLGFSVSPRSKLSGSWISDVVGLKNVDAEYVALTHPGPKVKIELIQYHSPLSQIPSASSQANQIGIRHLAFAVEDIEAVVGTLKTNGIKFFSEIRTYPATKKKLIYFQGPDGILLELAEYEKMCC